MKRVRIIYGKTEGRVIRDNGRAYMPTQQRKETHRGENIGGLLGKANEPAEHTARILSDCYTTTLQCSALSLPACRTVCKYWCINNAG